MNILKDFYFEKISSNPNGIIPTRGTEDSAGYDFYCLEDIIIPSYREVASKIRDHTFKPVSSGYVVWDDAESIVKHAHSKITLIPTGIKCHLPKNYYLSLSLRSSSPNKHWLILGNPPGIVDADYYNNPDNEGHIYFQVINLLPFDVKMPAGTKFGQGIVLPYYVTENDTSSAQRMGGFGST